MMVTIIYLLKNLLSQQIKSIKWILRVTTWLLVSQALYASVTIQFVTPDFDNVNPGSIVTGCAVLVNQDTVNHEGTISTLLPEAWNAFSDTQDSFFLAPGESHLHLIAIKVPPNAPAGSYPISLTVLFPSIPECTASTTLSVASQRSVTLELRNVPPLIAAGSRYDLVAVCHNKGNEGISVDLQALSNPHLSLENPEKTLFLPPGASVEKLLSINTQQTEGKSQCHYLNIIASDALSGETLCSAIAATEVLVCGSYSCKEWIYWPSTARFFAVGEKGANVLGVEISGEGFLDENECRSIDYLIRLPTDCRQNTYDQYQRFYLNLHDPNGELFLGDTVYRLTPLTEYGRYGRGLEIDYSWRQWSYGSFYVQDLHCHQKEAAAYLQYSFQDTSNISLNYLSKNHREDFFKSEILSVQFEYYPHEWLYIGGEVAGDVENNSHRFHHIKRQKDRAAYYVEMRGRYAQDTWYYAERYHAGSGFFGYYHNTDVTSGGISMPLRRYWRANFSTNHYRTHLYHRLESMPRRHQYEGQLSYDFASNGTLTVTELLLYARNTLNHSHGDNFKQFWQGVNLSYWWSNWSFFGSVNYGRMRNFNKNRSCHRSLQSYYAFLNWSQSPILQWQFHYEAGCTDLYDPCHWHYAIGASLLYSYDIRTQMELFGRAIRDDFKGRDNYKDHFHAMARFSHLFNNGHMLAMRGELFLSTHHHHPRNTHNEYKYIISYSVPFESPWKRRSDIGSIEGHVLDLENGVPLADVIVNLGGERTLTDSSGAYRFSGVAPGTYPLQTELLPRHRITCENDSQGVPIRGGQTISHNFSIVRTGALKGSIVLFSWDDSLAATEQMLSAKYSSELPLVNRGGIASIPITIDRNCGEEIYTTTTNSQGGFSFEDLRPGRWRVCIQEDMLPHNSVCESTFEVDIKSGEEAEFLIKVTPKSRMFLPLGKPHENDIECRYSFDV